MTKRIVFIVAWAVSLFLLTMIVLVGGWKIYFSATGSPPVRPSDDTLTWFGGTISIVPFLLGIMGAILGVLGVLPGTKRSI